MIFGMPAGELATVTAVLIAGGLLTGFLAGLLGIGGGGITVPILYELFTLLGVDDSVRMHMSVATSMAIIIPTSARSFALHWKRGGVDMAVLWRLMPWVTAGVVAGIIVASRSPGNFLKAVFIASALFMASRLLFAKEATLANKKLPGMPWDALAGLFTGLISTLMGIGGGAYITAYMRLFGWPIHQAVGTAAGFGPIIAIPAAIGYIVEGWGLAQLPGLTLGYVSILGVLIVAPLSVLAAPLGVRAAHGLPRRKLELAFVAFLLLVAVRFIVNLKFGI